MHPTQTAHFSAPHANVVFNGDGYAPVRGKRRLQSIVPALLQHATSRRRLFQQREVWHVAQFSIFECRIEHALQDLDRLNI
jgi:hypothetical protein